MSLGLRCPVTLKQGQFIDTYRGEIITFEEANKRGELRNKDEENYFFGFDKFVPKRTITKDEFLNLYPEKTRWHQELVEQGGWKPYLEGDDEMWLNPEWKEGQECKYVCDGMHMGGPTRFINHSCEPNCRLFTVSYNHYDRDIYDLAFFAIEEIPAGTELTFNYKDEDDTAPITEERADEIEKREGYRPQKCLCGSESCRGYFFN
ncbi:MAG: hypothetical protein Q9190_001128 [Brigantiaea leucoxantha]